ncbi:MAG: metallophosphoesterase [Clostridia bacterium]|nr:metallophosphoesterase [Clostridia bacterium]
MQNSIMNKSKKCIYKLLDIPYLPDYFNHIGRPLILHISDTPSSSYSYIYKLIRKLRPEYIIHTGDIVDDIKLEYYPKKIDNYINLLYKFINDINSIGIKEFYIIPGNHDNIDALKTIEKDINLICKDETINIGGLNICTSHKYSKNNEKCDFHLFGHNTIPINHRKKGTIYLNGLNNINIIESKTGKIHFLPYPMGTNNDRKLVPIKIGI